MAGLAAPPVPEGPLVPQAQPDLRGASEWGDNQLPWARAEQAGEEAGEEAEATAAELTLAAELDASPPRPLPPAAAAAAAAARGVSMAAWVRLEPSGLHVRSDAPAEVLGLGLGLGLLTLTRTLTLPLPLTLTRPRRRRVGWRCTSIRAACRPAEAPPSRSRRPASRRGPPG